MYMLYPYSCTQSLPREHLLRFSTQENLFFTEKRVCSAHSIREWSEGCVFCFCQIGFQDARAEAPIVLSSDVKNQFTGKNPDAGKD